MCKTASSKKSTCFAGDRAPNLTHSILPANSSKQEVDSPRPLGHLAPQQLPGLGVEFRGAEEAVGRRQIIEFFCF